MHEYVDRLRGVIDLQKEEIAFLKLQVKTLRGNAPAVAETESPSAPAPADRETFVHLVGSVKGHEQQVLSHLQQHLKQKHIRLMPSASAADAAITIKFHRMKTRLPTDELTSILAASPGPSCKLIVVFMHNIPRGHEKTMQPAGPNKTDPGQWQHFARQCYMTTNLTFDEDSWQWHDVNQCAARSISDAIEALV